MTKNLYALETIAGSVCFGICEHAAYLNVYATKKAAVIALKAIRASRPNHAHLYRVAQFERVEE